MRREKKEPRQSGRWSRMKRENMEVVQEEDVEREKVQQEGPRTREGELKL